MASLTVGFLRCLCISLGTRLSPSVKLQAFSQRAAHRASDPRLNLAASLFASEDQQYRATSAVPIAHYASALSWMRLVKMASCGIKRTELQDVLRVLTEGARQNPTVRLTQNSAQNIG